MRRKQSILRQSCEISHPIVTHTHTCISVHRQTQPFSWALFCQFCSRIFKIASSFLKNVNGNDLNFSSFSTARDGETNKLCQFAFDDIPIEILESRNECVHMCLLKTVISFFHSLFLFTLFTFCAFVIVVQLASQCDNSKCQFECVNIWTRNTC